MQKVEMTRFDARLSKQQKEFFEYAAKLGGFKSLTDFVLSSVYERAKKIVSEHNQILGSQKDQEIFFDALMNPPQANEYLKNASVRYEQFLKKKQ